MADLLAISARPRLDDNLFDDLVSAIDLRGDRERHLLSASDWRFASTHRRIQPCDGPRAYEDTRWVCLFAGDLIGHDNVPFAEILGAFDTESFSKLAEFSGVFAIVAYDKHTRKLYGVSDRRAQKSIFYSTCHAACIVATNLPVFTRLSSPARFNEAWLWQSLFFNFPVDSSTFLVDVQRLPPATILIFEEHTGRISFKNYSEPFSVRQPIQRGSEGLQLASEVFARRIPLHFSGTSEVACALTGGWDGRTMLALAPERALVTTYTYGGADCADRTSAKHTAETVGFAHREISFSESFVSELPRHAMETVYLSGGTQGVLRSTLKYAYTTLTEDGRKFPLAISGISLGTQFRGHATVPSIVSPAIAALFRAMPCELQVDYWRGKIVGQFDDFTELLRNNLRQLESRFGPFVDPGHHLAYALYEISPKYFGGELSIADHYTTVRVPAWDNELVDLSFSIEQGMLSFSQFLRGHKRGSRKEMVLQSYLLREFAPDIYDIPVGNARPSAVLSGNSNYMLYRVMRAAKRRISARSVSRRTAPLENWDDWFFSRHPAFLSSLLCSDECQVKEYVSTDFIEGVIERRDLHYLGKLLTMEIILRLIGSRWMLV